MDIRRWIDRYTRRLLRRTRQDVARAARDVAARRATAGDGTGEPESRSAHPTRSSKRGADRSQAAAPSRASTAATQPAGANAPTSADLPGPGEVAAEWDVKRWGLPDFAYRPRSNNVPDPGEVVWMWVPFDERDGRGKDRPVLVLASLGEDIVVAQMTSKDRADHGYARDARGNSWLDVGTGPWDPEGRPSELRLNRLLVVHESEVRREGSRLDPEIYQIAVDAIREVYGA